LSGRGPAGTAEWRVPFAELELEALLAMIGNGDR